jgi:CRP-like cAMP-binding protein
MRAPIEIPENVAKILSRISYFQALPHEALNRLGQDAHVITLRRDDILVAGGNSEIQNIYAVLEGQLHLGLPTADTLCSIRIIDSGMTLGESVLLMQKSAPYQAVATRKSRILVIEGKHWLNEVHSNPEMSLEVLKHMAQRRLDAMHTLAASSRRSDLSRVAGYVMEFRPKLQSECFSFELPARKLDIAANLGMSNASFSRALQRLRKDELVHVKGAFIQVFCASRLQQIAANRLTALSLAEPA